MAETAKQVVYQKADDTMNLRNAGTMKSVMMESLPLHRLGPSS